MSVVNIARRIAPLTGTEVMRELKADLIEANEVHTTSDQKRVFMENTLIAPVYHDEVADEAAMLALNDTAERGCWPMDACVRGDVGTFWLCVANHGESVDDWIEFSGAGGSYITNPMTTLGDIIIAGADGAPTRLGVSTNGFVLTLVSGAPAWAAASGGGGGSSVGGDLFLFQNFH